jgi:peptidoglycan/xylan/chitin deacetylase (PgdA/CDA1 family)
MVEAAHKAGMEIVSHTENHFDGSSAKFDAQYIRENLEQSLRELEAHIGSIPRILVYPYGHYTPEYIKVAQQVGFVMALTTHYGRHVDVHNLMLTPRVRVHGVGTMEKFEEGITGFKRQQ